MADARETRDTKLTMAKAVAIEMLADAGKQAGQQFQFRVIVMSQVCVVLWDIEEEVLQSKLIKVLRR